MRWCPPPSTKWPCPVRIASESEIKRLQCRDGRALSPCVVEGPAPPGAAPCLTWLGQVGCRIAPVSRRRRRLTGSSSVGQGSRCGASGTGTHVPGVGATILRTKPANSRTRVGGLCPLRAHTQEHLARPHTPVGSPQVLKSRPLDQDSPHPWRRGRILAVGKKRPQELSGRPPEGGL
jgi:hypothetical protein